METKNKNAIEILLNEKIKILQQENANFQKENYMLFENYKLYKKVLVEFQQNCKKNNIAKF